MSENKKEEKQIEETKDESKDVKDVTEMTVDLMRSQLIQKDEMLVKLTDALEDMTSKYKKANDLLEDQVKGKILADIKDKSTIPEALLSLKTYEDLVKYKEVLDTVIVPAFKSGTPISGKDSDPRKALDNQWNEYANRTWRKNR